MSQSFTLSIRKIASLDDRSPETLIATIELDSKSNIASLRQKLCSERIMASPDAFMLPSEREPKFALAKVDEDHKLWTTVLGDEDSITLLTTEKKEQDPQHKPGALRGGLGRLFGIRSNSDQETQSETVSSLAESSSGERYAVTAGILNASDLAEAVWENIVKGQSLNHGVTLGTGRASQDPGPQRAARPLVNYAHASVTRLVSDATTRDDSVFNTERNHRYAQKGWIDGTVNITTPYASASIEAVRSEAFARNMVNKTIHVTNTHIIQRAKLQFARELLTLSDEFQRRLDLIMSMQKDDEKRIAFEHLFESYGHVFPLEVVLGGTFIQSATGQVKDESEIEDKKNELRASLNAHIFGAGIGGGNSEEKGDSSRTLGFTSTIDVNGGDSTLILDPKSWMESVKNHHNWRVVRIEKVIPIVELVSPEARAEIARVAPPAKCKALYGKWIDLRPQALPDGMCKGLRQFPAPEISGDSWFWLGQPIGKRVLIVKERIPGSLCKIKSVEPIWSSKGKWPWLGMVNYLGNPFPEQSESFEALASCVYSQPRIDFKAPQPDLETEPWSKLRAVRHELLVAGECADKDIWNDKGKHGPDPASIWPIKYDDSTVDIKSFKAFAGRDKQSIGVWRLRADEVEMTE